MRLRAISAGNHLKRFYLIVDDGIRTRVLYHFWRVLSNIRLPRWLRTQLNSTLSFRLCHLQRDNESLNMMNCLVSMTTPTIV